MEAILKEAAESSQSESFFEAGPQSVTQVGLEANEGGVAGPSSLDPGLDPGTCAAAATAVAPQ